MLLVNDRKWNGYSSRGLTSCVQPPLGFDVKQSPRSRAGRETKTLEQEGANLGEFFQNFGLVKIFNM